MNYFFLNFYIFLGLCSHHPDYLLLVVSAIKGLTEVSENKIKFSSLFNLPIFVVITNLDECENPENEGKLDETLNDIRECFKVFLILFSYKYCMLIII